MVYYKHVVGGTTPAGTSWTTSLHSAGTASLASTQAAWKTFCTSFIGTTLAPLWNTHTAATECWTYQLDPTTGKAAFVAQDSLAIPGTGTGGSLSPRTTFNITTRTAAAGKAGRGRMYWPVPDDTHIQPNGQLVSADATTIKNGFQTAYGTFKVTSIGIVWHKSLKLGDTIIDIEVNLGLGTQRRRTDKVARAVISGPV